MSFDAEKIHETRYQRTELSGFLRARVIHSQRKLGFWSVACDLMNECTKPSSHRWKTVIEYWLANIGHECPFSRAALGRDEVENGVLLLTEIHRMIDLPSSVGVLQLETSLNRKTFILRHGPFG